MKPGQWRRSSAGPWLRHLPRMKHLRGTWLHRKFGDRLFSFEMWQPERARFASGCAIGVFFGMIPFPAQMLSAALVAYLTRVNIPAAVASTWASNPLTMPFLIFLQYKTGMFMMGRGGENLHTTDVWLLLSRAPLPLLAGSLVVGAILAVLAYPVALFGWDVVTKYFLQPRRRKAKTPAAPPL